MNYLCSICGNPSNRPAHVACNFNPEPKRRQRLMTFGKLLISRPLNQRATGTGDTAGNGAVPAGSTVSTRAAAGPTYWPETQHERDCLYVTSNGPAPCTCKAGEAARSKI